MPRPVTHYLSSAALTARFIADALNQADAYDHVDSARWRNGRILHAIEEAEELTARLQAIKAHYLPDAPAEPKADAA